MALSSGGLPENIGTALSEFMSQAQRLGIVWSLRLATVTGNIDVIQNTSATRIVLDGDDARITANSLIGRLAGTTRVFVMFVPPAGSYIIGRIDFGAGSPPHTFQDVIINGNLSVAGVATFGNEAFGSVSVAGGSGTVTSSPISYGPLVGSGNIQGFVTAITGSNAFVFASLTGVGASGATVNVLRNNATATSIYWYIRRSLT